MSEHLRLRKTLFIQDYLYPIYQFANSLAILLVGFMSTLCPKQLAGKVGHFKGSNGLKIILLLM